MRIAVQGQTALQGDYTPSGNSNAAIATIAASLLTDAPVTLQHVPNTLSTEQMLHLAEQLGATVTRNESTIQIETPHIQSRSLSASIINSFPASLLFLPAILTRRRHAHVEWEQSSPRIYPHLTAMQDLGLTIEPDSTGVSITAVPWDTAELALPWPSVTATALVCMLAATLGTKTTLYNAASEPHLRILQHQLVQMGAKIEGIGSNLVTIYGLSGEPSGANIQLPFDHIEIASVAAIAAITGGQVSIQNVHLADMRMILKVYERLGLRYYLQKTDDEANRILHIPEQDSLRVQVIGDGTLPIDTSPWPGFPSDLVAITTVLATQVRGTTLIHEKLFDNRLLFTDKLKAMGAQVLLCDPHRAIVIGKCQLYGEYIDSPDVRVGMALLAAALGAEGESIIDNAELIDRTFEQVITKLQYIGARIEVVQS
ncbi:MAG: UDP-N-acetylglucosamine 1-carboxyvinyltransferase [Anaerolineales bacterium]|nr:UDP-N-acetylglucosamine 1-carboxyvinyltransferase [Anaerolineales bacterium]